MEKKCLSKIYLACFVEQRYDEFSVQCAATREPTTIMLTSLWTTRPKAKHLGSPLLGMKQLYLLVFFFLNAYFILWGNLLCFSAHKSHTSMCIIYTHIAYTFPLEQFKPL